MSEKIKQWFRAQENDVKKLFICFIIAFILYLIITRDILNALEAGFGWTIAFVFIINAFRFWKGVAKRAGVPTDTQPQDVPIVKNEEKEILNNLVNHLRSNKEMLEKKELDDLIIKEIKKTTIFKNDWQIDYAKERIKKALIEHLNLAK